MAQVTIAVNGRSYTVACDDGEEEHLRYLADYVNHQIEGLVETLGQVGEARLLLMAALLIADDLHDAMIERGGPDARLGGLERGDGEGRAAPASQALAGSLAALAERVEDIAARLKTA